MLNSSIVKSAIDTIAFELELADKATHFNKANPHTVQLFTTNIKADHSAAIESNNDLEKAIAELESELNRHADSTANVSKDDLKAVYIMLKDRLLHPAGEFDKMGRFYLEDYELVDVRSPSSKYPFSQMNAGRTSKFVAAIADKYKVQNRDELIALFRKAK